MLLNGPAATIPPTVVDQDVSGVQVEYTDMALSNGTFWGSPPKICKGDALLNLSLKEAGTATRLCLDLLVNHWNEVIFGPMKAMIEDLPLPRFVREGRAYSSASGTAIGQTKHLATIVFPC